MPIEIDLLNVEGEDHPRVIRAVVTGQLHESDYHYLVPQIEEILERRASVRMLVQLSDFKGWSPGAAWEDTKLGFHHYADFERLAVVGDKHWESWMTRLSQPFTLADVRFFEPVDMEKALVWVTEPLQPHIRISVEENHRVVRVRPSGRLSKEDFIRLADEIDPLIEQWGALNGLVIESRDFPGWESVGALIRHLRFVSEHHRRIRRIAVVTDSRLGAIAGHLASHVVAAKIKQFESDDLDVALSWAAKPGTDPTTGPVRRPCAARLASILCCRRRPVGDSCRSAFMPAFWKVKG